MSDAVDAADSASSSMCWCDFVCVELKEFIKRKLTCQFWVNFEVAQVSFDCRRMEVQKIGLPLLTLKEPIAVACIVFPSGAKSWYDNSCYLHFIDTSFNANGGASLQEPAMLCSKHLEYFFLVHPNLCVFSWLKTTCSCFCRLWVWAFLGLQQWCPMVWKPRHFRMVPWPEKDHWEHFLVAWAHDGGDPPIYPKTGSCELGAFLVICI